MFDQFSDGIAVCANARRAGVRKDFQALEHFPT
jgi:hypothetical protein